MSSIAATVAEASPEKARQYGMEKLAAEKVFLSLPPEKHQVVVLRPPAVYGPGMQNSMAILAKLIRKGIPIPLGAATLRRHYISLRNLVDLVEAVVGSDERAWVDANGHIYEPSDDQAISTRDLIQMMSALLGRRPRLVPVPLWLLRVIGSATGRSAIVGGAIDPLELTPSAELHHRFRWHPAEGMPASLTFLTDEF
jgi:UDP-glucose 4-epimerase